jgi:hypothetical protein
MQTDRIGRPASKAPILRSVNERRQMFLLLDHGFRIIVPADRIGTGY